MRTIPVEARAVGRKHRVAISIGLLKGTPPTVFVCYRVAVLKQELNSDMGVLLAHAQIDAVGIRVVEYHQLHAVEIKGFAKPSAHEGLERSDFLPDGLLENCPTVWAGIRVTIVKLIGTLRFCPQERFYHNPVDVKIAIIWHVNYQRFFEVARAGS